MLTARLYIKRESAEACVVNEETVCIYTIIIHF